MQILTWLPHAVKTIVLCELDCNIQVLDLIMIDFGQRFRALAIIEIKTTTHNAYTGSGVYLLPSQLKIYPPSTNPCSSLNQPRQISTLPVGFDSVVSNASTQIHVWIVAPPTGSRSPSVDLPSIGLSHPISPASALSCNPTPYLLLRPPPSCPVPLALLLCLSVGTVELSSPPRVPLDPSRSPTCPADTRIDTRSYPRDLNLSTPINPNRPN